MTGTYRLLDDIALADTAFDAEGDTPTELCDIAARALMELMADPATIGTTWTHTVECAAEDLGELLYDWLNQLVFLKDAHGVLFHDVRVRVTEGRAAPRWRLHADLSGAPVDPTSQELRADVKAVTKHLYRVMPSGTHWRARVVVDV